MYPCNEIQFDVDLLTANNLSSITGKLNQQKVPIVAKTYIMGILEDANFLAIKKIVLHCSQGAFNWPIAFMGRLLMMERL